MKKPRHMEEPHKSGKRGDRREQAHRLEGVVKKQAIKPKKKKKKSV